MRPREEDPSVATLVRECEAVVDGTYAEYLEDAGKPVPPWAWLNLLAHGTEDHVRRAVHPAGTERADDPWRGWRQARCFLAGEVLDLARLADCSLQEVQARVLVPLELALLPTGVSSWWGPGQLVATVLAALHQQPTPPGRP